MAQPKKPSSQRSIDDLVRDAARKLPAKARLALVEETLRAKGWSEAAVQSLVRKTGASRRTLYRDRDRVAAMLATEESAGLADRRALFLVELRRTRRRADRDGKYSATARMLGMEAQILGVDRAPLPDVEEPDGPLDTSLEGMLKEVRRLRRRADAGDSYVAVEKLIDRECALIEGIRLREDAKVKAERRELDEAGLLDLALGNIANLPEKVKAKIRAAVG